MREENGGVRGSVCRGNIDRTLLLPFPPFPPYSKDGRRIRMGFGWAGWAIPRQNGACLDWSGLPLNMWRRMFLSSTWLPTLRDTILWEIKKKRASPLAPDFHFPQKKNLINISTRPWSAATVEKLSYKNGEETSLLLLLVPHILSPFH